MLSSSLLNLRSSEASGPSTLAQRSGEGIANKRIPPSPSRGMDGGDARYDFESLLGALLNPAFCLFFYFL
jgi:hypothetical protein